MKKSLIIALNEINSDFYTQIAREFSDSRKYYWHGWKLLVPHLNELTKQKRTLTVLDIGCGNGRFAQFLVEQLPNITINYTGVDSNQKLLDIANQKLDELEIPTTLIQADIIKDLLNNTFLAEQNKFDLIVAFGVVHHIPSLELRTTFFSTIKKFLDENGLAVITLWNFMEIARMQKKQQEFTDTQIEVSELEANDYLLSWDRGTRAYRYCHFSDEEEKLELLESSGLRLEHTYQADSKEGTGNTYLVLK